MKKFEIVHEIACDAARFWEMFFDDAYNEALYKQVGLKERRFLELTDTPTHKHWVMRVIPERDLPGFLKKLVNGDFGYEETATLDKAANQITCKIRPTLLSERITIESTYTLEPIGPDRVRRIYAGTVDVALPLVGGKIEEFILRDVEASYTTTAAFSNEWLAGKR